MKILVTGGAGFIGSNFIRHLLGSNQDLKITNFDKLTYAGNPESLADLANDHRYTFCLGDIANKEEVDRVLDSTFHAVVNFAAETHVDRSIEEASPFLTTNILGTRCLLEAARRLRLPRFIQISTDEVYGSAPARVSFTEESALDPRSPYAATKAAADHLVSAYANTYGVSAVILRCTNNFGPYQFPEKLIPLIIRNAGRDQPLPIYGDGLQERDWLYVEDYCRAIELVLKSPKPGPVFNISSGTPRPNLSIVKTVLLEMNKPYSLIQHVQDRPGHDRRYAIDSSKFRAEFGWAPRVSFEEGIRRTTSWYGANPAWLANACSGEYLTFYDRHYANRAETSSG